MTITIQKELAERLAARPCTKDYGALSIWVQSQCRVEILRIMPPAVFWPRPKVDSAIVQIVLEPERRQAIPDLAAFHDFVRRVFLHRRKFLRGALVPSFDHRLDKPACDAILEELCWPANIRAEELSIDQMLDLCAKVRERIS